MNLNYAIFRSQPIMTINDLAGIGSHNKRENQSYKSKKYVQKVCCKKISDMLL